MRRLSAADHCQSEAALRVTALRNWLNVVERVGRGRRLDSDYLFVLFPESPGRSFVLLQFHKAPRALSPSAPPLPACYGRVSCRGEFIVCVSPGLSAVNSPLSFHLFSRSGPEDLHTSSYNVNHDSGSRSTVILTLEGESADATLRRLHSAARKLRWPSSPWLPIPTGHLFD